MLTELEINFDVYINGIKEYSKNSNLHKFNNC